MFGSVCILQLFLFLVQSKQVMVIYVGIKGFKRNFFLWPSPAQEVVKFLTRNIWIYNLSMLPLELPKLVSIFICQANAKGIGWLWSICYLFRQVQKSTVKVIECVLNTDKKKEEEEKECVLNIFMYVYVLNFFLEELEIKSVW